MSWTYFLGIALAPLFFVVLIGFIAAPIKRVIARTLPESWLKRVLFFSWRL